MPAMLTRLILLFCLGIVSVGSLASAQDEAIAEAVAEPATAADEELASAKPEKPQPRPLTVSVGLLDDTKLTGTLTESNTIAIKTAFGEASIPLSEVAGIRFPAADDTSTTIVMLNGDSITGATDLKHVSIETVWGSAKINGANIGTLLFVPGLSWTSNEMLGGKRWTLVESTSAQAPGNLPSAAGQLPGSGNVNSNGIRVGNPQQLPSLPPSRPQGFLGQ